MFKMKITHYQKKECSQYTGRLKSPDHLRKDGGA